MKSVTLSNQLAAIFSSQTPSDEVDLLKRDLSHFRQNSNKLDANLDYNLLNRMSFVSQEKDKLRELFYSYNLQKFALFSSNKYNLILLENYLRLLHDTISGINSLTDIELMLFNFNERIDTEAIANYEKNYLRHVLKKLQSKTEKQEHFLTQSI